MQKSNNDMEALKSDYENLPQEAREKIDRAIEEAAELLKMTILHKSAAIGGLEKYSEVLKAFVDEMEQEELTEEEKKEILLETDPWDFMPSDKMKEPLKEITTRVRDRAFIKCGIAIERTSKKLTEMIYPVDKVNSVLWNHLPAGKHSIKLESSKDTKKGNIITGSLTLGFLDSLPEGVEISKDITPYDLIIYTIAGNLYLAGNDVFSLSAIAKVLKVSENQNTKDKIQKSIDKMMFGTTIKVDVTEEITKGNYNYPATFPRKTMLLPGAYIPAIINGKATDGAIFLYELPPLMKFAKDRNQVAPISPAILNFPVNLTERSAAVWVYLTRRIARAKNTKTNGKKTKKDGEKKQERILFKTLYAEVFKDVKPTKRQENNVKKTAAAFLKSFKEAGWIEYYSDKKNRATEAEGFTIIL